MAYWLVMNKKIRQIPAEETYALRQRVMWPQKPLTFIILPNDAHGIHYGLYVDEVLVSVVSLFIENKIAQFRKLATDQKEQQKGYGSMLLTHLLNCAEDYKVNKIWCNARLDKQDFYKKFGFSPTNTRFNKAGQDYVIMEKYF